MKQTILNLWQDDSDNSKANYDVENEITDNTEVLKSNLSDCNDAYIIVRGDITSSSCNTSSIYKLSTIY